MGELLDSKQKIAKYFQSISGFRNRWKIRQKSPSDEHLLRYLFEKSYYKTLVIYLRNIFFNKMNRTENWDRKIESEIHDNAVKVVEYYEAHIKQVKALSKEYGFKAFFFW